MSLPRGYIAGDGLSLHPWQHDEPSRRFRHAVTAALAEVGQPSAAWNGRSLLGDTMWQFCDVPPGVNRYEWLTAFCRAIELAERIAGAPVEVRIRPAPSGTIATTSP